jgi:hypothetical protein
VACIAGAIAESFYSGVPDHIRKPVMEKPGERLEGVVNEFAKRYRHMSR